MSENFFKTGQIINQSSRAYTRAAIWCNAGNGVLTDLGDGTSRIDGVKQPTQEENNTQRIVEIDVELSTLDKEQQVHSLRLQAKQLAGATDSVAVEHILRIEGLKDALRAERVTLVG